MPSANGSRARAGESASSAASTGSDSAGRPRETLNMTVQELGALYGPYYHCIYARTGPKAVRSGSGYALAPGYAQRYKDATVACHGLEPLPPVQLDPANPQARAFIGRTVTCLRAAGFNARAKLQPDSEYDVAEWVVAYTPGSVGVFPPAEHAEARCHEKALK